MVAGTGGGRGWCGRARRSTDWGFEVAGNGGPSETREARLRAPGYGVGDPGPARDTTFARAGAGADAAPGTAPGAAPRPKWAGNVDTGRPVGILVVCTAHRCRSPMAEALLRSRLAAVKAPAFVVSAGVAAVDGLPATPDALEAAGGPSGHRSRLVTPDLVERADLVLGMTHEHVRDLALLAPAAFGRTFTIKEAARRAEPVGPRWQGEAFGAWVARIGIGRRATDLVGFSDDDDIADPVGRPPAVYRQCAEEIGACLSTLVALAFPPEA